MYDIRSTALTDLVDTIFDVYKDQNYSSIPRFKLKEILKQLLEKAE
jgi:hypothetical protein